MNDVSDTLFCEKVNETWIRVHADKSVMSLLSDHFTFEVPGAKFMPAFKGRKWDGKLRLLNSRNGLIYKGLYEKIKQFGEFNDYNVACNFDKELGTPISPEALLAFVKSLKLKLVPHDHQIKAFREAIDKRRVTILSPTASGKSLLIYLITSYFNEDSQKPSLIIVPTINLVRQMAGDFIEYDSRCEKKIKLIMGGETTEVKKNHRYVISTWQSIYEEDPDFFNQFGTIIGDEAHNYKAKVIRGMLEKATDVPNRIGTTGTLDGTECNELILTGLFGSVFKTISSVELMEKKLLTPVKIKAILLNHTDFKKQNTPKMDYQSEIAYINAHEKRNAFITRFCGDLKGNTLLLFNHVETHGILLYNIMIARGLGDKTHLIHGGVDVDDREEIRKLLEKNTGINLIASVGTFSTGANVKNLHNIILAAPSKSKIRVLQSIGRGLRLHDSKDVCNIYDFGDDISGQNYTLKHFIQRIEYYAAEGFDYKIIKLEI